MGRVVHFEIHAGDPARAAKFYEELFDWTITKWDGPMDYWLVMTGKESDMGIDGAILKRMGDNPDRDDPTPVIAYVCTVDVDDVDASIEKAMKGGASIAMEKHTIPGVGDHVYMKDTEGNIFGMLQAAPEMMEAAELKAANETPHR